MATITDYQIHILERFGFELLSSNALEFVNPARARKADLHHTFLPIAAVGWARLAPEMAMYRLQDYTLCKLVTKRPSMDCSTAELFALACNLKIQGQFYNRPEPFYLHLCRTIDTHDLGAFFGHFPHEDGYHYSVRPRGIDWKAGWDELPLERKNWRTAYSQLPRTMQMLVATILWLYGGPRVEYWLEDLSHSWAAMDAIVELENAGMLAHWAELVTLYPGW